MESFDIDKLFESAAAEVRPPSVAPYESLRCRAYYATQYSFGALLRCNRTVEQHDGVCWAHSDYYCNWWTRHVPNSEYMEDILMGDNFEEMRFQIEGGHVSLKDPMLLERLTQHPFSTLFFLWLCNYEDFDATKFIGHISACTNHIVKHDILYFRKPYELAFASLHRYFDRGLIFEHYLLHSLHWLNDNILGCIGPANIFEGLLNGAVVSFREVAGKRLQLAEHLKILRNRYIKLAEDDDRYTSCKGRFWMWISRLKQEARDEYEPLRGEILATTWAPARMPFWCLDSDEIAEDYPEGLPNKAEFAALCASIVI